MPARETYVLHIYRNRAVRGGQWAARLEHLGGRENIRFTDPEALLTHLRTVLQAGGDSDPSGNGPTGTDGPETGPQS